MIRFFFFSFLFLFQLQGDADLIQLQDLNGYLIDNSHPAKKSLDRLFKNPSILNNDHSLLKAGFDLRRSRNEPEHVKVASHKKLYGYLIKTFTNENGVFQEHPHFLKRAMNARKIQETIEQLGYDSLFKVPKKWIYLIKNTNHTSTRKSILIVEDMQIVDHHTNQKLWNNPKITTKKTLTALYTLLTLLGLLDSVYIDNIPYSKDGKIAFIDTEHLNLWPVECHKLTGWIHKDLQPYWTQLIQKDSL